MQRAFATHGICSREFPSENHKFDKFLQEAAAVYKEAGLKPDPFDAKGQRQIETDNRPIQVAMPGAQYRFKTQDPETVLTDGFEIELVPYDKPQIIVP